MVIMTQKITNRILILDFGSQVTQLIAKTVRKSNIYAEIKPYNIPFNEIKSYNAAGIILSGGPASVTDKDSPTIDPAIYDLGIPILGICYGQQLMCSQLGGKVEPSHEREFGRAFIKINKLSALYENVWSQGNSYEVWMSHGDKVTKIPDGFMAVADTPSTPYAIIADEKRKFYGVQFHPEVTHTPDGAKLLKNFTHNVCGLKGDWSMSSFLDYAVEKIRNQVGDKKVLCAVSGGVDSSVVAALLHRAIGDQVKCIFIDTGCLRLNEAAQVKELFSQYFHIPLHTCDAGDLFLSRLKNITDPEEKRKIIGKTFIDIFEEEAHKLGGADFLAQGTLYPDVVESVSAFGSPTVTIKSHHNVGGLPERMKMKLVEPVRELFKDEVRELGRVLGMPDEMVGRHPFPGPGLAIRVIGEVTKERLDILRQADAIFIEQLKKEELYNKIWQAFVVLLPIRTVGVMGDGRTYEYTCAIRSVTSTDGMTADFYCFPGNFLSKIGSHIIGNVKGINRVVYDITSKPPATIEWE